MSEYVRTAFSQEIKEISTNDMLDTIYDHYISACDLHPELQKVACYEVVAKAVSNQVSGRSWKWRYIQSIRSGTLEPSALIEYAIGKLYENIKQMKEKKKARSKGPKKKYRYIRIREDDFNAVKAAIKILDSDLTSEQIGELAKLIDLPRGE